MSGSTEHMCFLVEVTWLDQSPHIDPAEQEEENHHLFVIVVSLVAGWFVGHVPKHVLKVIVFQRNMKFFIETHSPFTILECCRSVGLVLASIHLVSWAMEEIIGLGPPKRAWQWCLPQFTIFSRIESKRRYFGLGLGVELYSASSLILRKIRCKKLPRLPTSENLRSAIFCRPIFFWNSWAVFLVSGGK